LSDAGPTASPAAEGSGLSLDEQAELARLRAEVSALRARQAAPARRRHVGWRAPVAVILIVLGSVLAPISVLGIWTANQVSNTDRYVANVEPLVHDPAVQNALTDKITNAITAQANVTGYANQAAAALSARDCLASRRCCRRSPRRSAAPSPDTSMARCTR